VYSPATGRSTAKLHRAAPGVGRNTHTRWGEYNNARVKTKRNDKKKNKKPTDKITHDGTSFVRTLGILTLRMPRANDTGDTLIRRVKSPRSHPIMYIVIKSAAGAHGRSREKNGHRRYRRVSRPAGFRLRKYVRAQSGPVRYVFSYRGAVHKSGPSSYL